MSYHVTRIPTILEANSRASLSNCQELVVPSGCTKDYTNETLIQVIEALTHPYPPGRYNIVISATYVSKHRLAGSVQTETRSFVTGCFNKQTV